MANVVSKWKEGWRCFYDDNRTWCQHLSWVIWSQVKSAKYWWLRSDHSDSRSWTHVTTLLVSVWKQMPPRDIVGRYSFRINHFLHLWMYGTEQCNWLCDVLTTAISAVCLESMRRIFCSRGADQVTVLVSVVGGGNLCLLRLTGSFHFQCGLLL